MDPKDKERCISQIKKSITNYEKTGEEENLKDIGRIINYYKQKKRSQ